MKTQSTNNSGWIVAVFTLALFNFIQFQEKVQLKELLEGKPPESKSNNLAASHISNPPPIEDTSKLTNEQASNLEAERDFESPTVTEPDSSSYVTEADSSPSSESPSSEPAIKNEYVGSSRSDKFHSPYCSAANRIKEDNLVYFASRGGSSFCRPGSMQDL